MGKSINGYGVSYYDAPLGIALSDYHYLSLSVLIKPRIIGSKGRTFKKLTFGKYKRKMPKLRIRAQEDILINNKTKYPLGFCEVYTMLIHD